MNMICMLYSEFAYGEWNLESSLLAGLKHFLPVENLKIGGEYLGGPYNKLILFYESTQNSHNSCF